MTTDVEIAESGSTPEQAPVRKSKTKKVLLIIGALAAVFAIWMGSLIYKGVKDRPLVEAKLTEFIQLAQDDKYDEAYNNLIAREFQEAYTPDQFEKAFSYPVLYSGFQRIEFQGFTVKQFNSRVYYLYSGTVLYSDESRGQLTATLIKEEGEYKIYDLRIAVSPDRANPSE